MSGRVRDGPTHIRRSPRARHRDGLPFPGRWRRLTHGRPERDASSTVDGAGIEGASPRSAPSEDGCISGPHRGGGARLASGTIGGSKDAPMLPFPGPLNPVFRLVDSRRRLAKPEALAPPGARAAPDPLPPAPWAPHDHRTAAREGRGGCVTDRLPEADLKRGPSPGCERMVPRVERGAKLQSLHRREVRGHLPRDLWNLHKMHRRGRVGSGVHALRRGTSRREIAPLILSALNHVALCGRA